MPHADGRCGTCAIQQASPVPRLPLQIRASRVALARTIRCQRLCRGLPLCHGACRKLRAYAIRNLAWHRLLEVRRIVAYNDIGAHAVIMRARLSRNKLARAMHDGWKCARCVCLALAVGRLCLFDCLPLRVRARGQCCADTVRLPGHVRRGAPARGSSRLVLAGEIARAQRRAHSGVVRSGISRSPLLMGTNGMVSALAVRGGGVCLRLPLRWSTFCDLCAYAIATCSRCCRFELIGGAHCVSLAHAVTDGGGCLCLPLISLAYGVALAHAVIVRSTIEGLPLR